MALAIFFAITIILLISFVVTRKKLSLLEIFFLWMVINIIHHNFVTIATVNLQLFDFGANPANFWTLEFIRVFLMPILMIWYFDITLAENPYKRWGWLPLGILALIGVEYVADVLGIFRQIRWKYSWSIIEWFVIFLLVNYSWIWYRTLLRKEMN